MTHVNGSDRVRFGAYEVDLHTCELWKHGTRVKLVGQPFEILAVLLSRPGQLVTREELRTELWPGDTFVDFNHGLNAAVNKLRDALCDSADDPKYIETLPRRGYRFIASVEVQRPAPGVIDNNRAQTGAGLEPASTVQTALPLAELQTSPVVMVPPLFAEQPAAPPKRRQRLPYLVAAAVVVLAIWFVWDPLRPNPERDEKLAAEKAKVRPPVLLTSL